MKEKSMATAFVCRRSMHLPQVPSLTHSFSSSSEEVLKQGRNIVQFSKAGFGKGANQETSFRERKARIICNVNYRVELLTPTGERHVLEIPNDKYILDAAQEENIELPYCCRSGACSTCAGIIVKGIVDQSEQTTLDPEQEKEGYVMMCVAYPRSDLVIETHQEGKLYIY